MSKIPKLTKGVSLFSDSSATEKSKTNDEEPTSIKKAKKVPSYL